MIELLIVIVIIGVVYTLSVANISKINDASSNLSLANLKEYLQSFEYTKSVKLLCLDDCSECTIFVDDEKEKTLENFLDNTVSIYRYESLYGYTEDEKEIYFNLENIEEDVCFSYEIDKNGVGNQVLVAFKDKFYDFSTYFSPVKIYTSIEDALESREKLAQEVTR